MIDQRPGTEPAFVILRAVDVDRGDELDNPVAQGCADASVVRPVLRDQVMVVWVQRILERIEVGRFHGAVSPAALVESAGMGRIPNRSPTLSLVRE